MAEELELMVIEKQNKELISLLKQLLSKKVEADPELKTAIGKLNVQIEYFADAISKIEIKAPSANVTVQNKNEEIISLATTINKNLDELKKLVSKEEKKEWRFTIKRDQNNYISEVIAKQI